MENKNREINTNQLYREAHFKRYCEQDEMSSVKVTRHIPEDFLPACKKDGLIMPIVEREEEMKQKDGTVTTYTARYYSPFQIYLVSAFVNNVVNEEGVLQDPENLDWQKQQGARYIKWSDSSSFLVQAYKDKPDEDVNDRMEVNHFNIAMAGPNRKSLS